MEEPGTEVQAPLEVQGRGRTGRGELGGESRGPRRSKRRCSSMWRNGSRRRSRGKGWRICRRGRGSVRSRGRSSNRRGRSMCRSGSGLPPRPTEHRRRRVVHGALPKPLVLQQLVELFILLPTVALHHAPWLGAACRPGRHTVCKWN